MKHAAIDLHQERAMKIASGSFTATFLKEVEVSQYLNSRNASNPLHMLLAEHSATKNYETISSLGLAAERLSTLHKTFTLGSAAKEFQKLNGLGSRFSHLMTRESSLTRLMDREFGVQRIGSAFEKIQNSQSNSALLNKSLNLFGNLDFQNKNISTIGSLYKELIKQSQESNSKNTSKNIETAFQKIEQEISNSPKSSLSKDFYYGLILNFIFGCVLFLVSESNTEQDSKILTQKINDVQERLLDAIKQLDSDEKNEIHYVVKRFVHLTTEPNSKFKPITILYPNTKVRLLERSSKWIRIEYYDYIQDRLISGWSRKKYLKMIRLQQPAISIKHK